VNYYDLLQVNKDASQDEIADAFRRLIKQCHPDRFSSPEEKAEAEKRFQDITAAFNVLKDPEKRKEYDRTLDEGPDITSHEDLKAQAQQYFKNGLYQLNTLANHRLAKEFFKKASYLDKDNAKYLYYLALSQAPDPKKRREAVANLEKAISLDPFSALYRARIGTIYLESGMRTRARKYFEKAIKLDPECEEAIEGLAKLGVRLSSETGKKGFLSRLFGSK